MFDRNVSTTQTNLETALSEINTSVPGTIISYDPATNRAVVKPDLPKRLANDESLDAPQIVEVPLLWTASGGGASTFTMPIKPGDGVMLTFQQRSLEGWLSGNKEMPDDPRQFDLSDCVAIPGCQPSGIAADPNDVVLKFNKAQLRIMPDGTIILGNDKGSMRIDGNTGTITFSNGATGVTVDNQGNIGLVGSTINVSTSERSFVLENHQHTNVRTGVETSGPPLG
jgi:hypothetical protein